MRVGVIGTFVWDTIWTLDDQRAGRATESWGGVTYSLAAAAAACPPGWRVVPIARVGADLVEEARRFAAAHDRVDAGRIVSVPAANNRVELRYSDHAARDERLTGGVPAWEWDALAPLLDGIDALYVNFLSGFEVELEAAERLRDRFAGPIYADLHSLFLGPPGDHARVPRILADWDRWLRCFHAVQVNEDELAMLAASIGAATLAPEAILDHGPGMVVLTRGARGAAVATRLPEAPMQWRNAPGSTAPRRIEVPAAASAGGDPTGCGDVFGATLFLRLLAGDGTAAAAGAASAAAGRKLSHRGADGLARHLRAG